jgi:8-oxo-dGTP pyrophosphatase MutT (NUDIX family)
MGVRTTGEEGVIRQVAALPYRFGGDGALEVLLVTSRGSAKHWVPPKGHLIAGLEPHEAAAQEAYEEAGVVGAISLTPLGAYSSIKAGADGMRTLDITLFPLQFLRRESDWPERGQRTILWFDRQSAAKIVRDAGLARLIDGFHP